MGIQIVYILGNGFQPGVIRSQLPPTPPPPPGILAMSGNIFRFYDWVGWVATGV